MNVAKEFLFLQVSSRNSRKSISKTQNYPQIYAKITTYNARVDKYHNQVVNFSLTRKLCLVQISFLDYAESGILRKN